LKNLNPCETTKIGGEADLDIFKDLPFCRVDLLYPAYPQGWREEPILPGGYEFLANLERIPLGNKSQTACGFSYPLGNSTGSPVRYDIYSAVRIEDRKNMGERTCNPNHPSYNPFRGENHITPCRGQGGGEMDPEIAVKIRRILINHPPADQVPELILIPP
jgi:hypothetical protein